MNKIFKWAIRGGTFVLVTAATLFGAYSLIPARQKVITFDEGSQGQGETQTTFFNKFVSNLKSAVDGDNEQPLGLSASLEGFEITWPSKDETIMNDIKLNGSLNLLMDGIQNLDFTLDVDANYNNKEVSLGLGLCDGTLYLAFQDLRIKSSHSSTLDILEKAYDLFLNPNNPDGLGLNLDIQEIVDELTAKVDIASLLGGLSLPKTTETVENGLVTINLAMDEMNIILVVEEDTCALRKVDLGEIKVGNATIKGVLECNTITQVIPFDSELYPNPRGEFVETISYIGWLDRLLDLFKTKQIGLNFDADIALVGDDGSSKLTSLAASINVDLSDIFDFNTLKTSDLDELDELEYDENGGISPLCAPELSENENPSILDKIKGIYNPDGKLKFGIHATAKGQKESEYLNLDLSYFDNAGYLTFNEKENSDAVMQAKIEKDTVSTLIDKIPGLIALVAPANKNTNAEKVEKTTDKLFSFITDSKLVNAIKNGEYSEIINLISNISNDGDKINLSLNLSSLGLGDGANIDLALDSKNDNSLLGIGFDNIDLGGVVLNADLNTADYTEEHIKAVQAKKDRYDDMSFALDIIDQASDVLSVKTGKLTLAGSIIDPNTKEGVDIVDGTVAQFDANQFVGFGSVILKQHDSKVKNSKGYITHKIDFDINNDSHDESARNMLFSYNENLKAKITTGTVTDIFNLFEDLLNSKDERFTKFGGSILEMLLGSTIKNVIEAKDYLEFAKSSYIKSIKQLPGATAIQIIINGDVFNMESDIVISLDFSMKDNKKILSGLTIKDLAFSGKTINITAKLEEMDSNYSSPINKLDTFIDFSQVKVLLDFGINTTKLNYYHLTADLELSIVGIKAIKPKLDFYISVNGKETKVYGTITNIPWLSDFLSRDLGSCTVSTEFVFEPVDDIGGNFHIAVSKDYWLKQDKIDYYKADSKYFLDHIIDYLVYDCLNIKPGTIDSLSDLSFDSGDSDADFSRMFTSDGFKYSHNDISGLASWNVGLNMDKITAIDALKTLELTLNGKDQPGGSGLFTDAVINMKIASVIEIKCTLKLVNPSFNDATWPTSIQNKYQTVLNYYEKLSSKSKSTFDQKYFNHSVTPYSFNK